MSGTISQRQGRATRDLCGDCHLDVNPTQYAPLATRWGTCDRCGYEALVARSRIADEEPDTFTASDDEDEREVGTGAVEDDRYYTDAGGQRRHNDGTLCHGLDH